MSAMTPLLSTLRFTFPHPILVFAMIFTTAAFAGPRDKRWDDVQRHMEKGLPQSAIEVVKTIEAEAAAEKAWAEAAKALCYRVALEAEIQGSRPEEKIVRLEPELAKAPAELLPVLQTVQAHWYWDYFDQNRWRIMDRTQTAGSSGDDIATWDLRRIYAEIDGRFQKALEHPEPLQSAPISAFDGLLEQGTLPDSCRPTLFDFLANEALTFYTSGEQAGAKPEDAFEFDAASPALAPMAAFLAWNPETSDEASPKLRAIRLFQDLLRFHKNDADPGARLMVDSDRLTWAAETAVGEGVKERLIKRLVALIDANGQHEAAVYLAQTAAKAMQNRDQLVEAQKLANDLAGRFPDSIFAPALRNLVREIESKSLVVRTEGVWNQAGPELVVDYKNVPKVWMRLYHIPWKPGKERWQTPDRLDDDDVERLIEKSPEKTWSIELPPTEDFRERHHQNTMPTEGLDPGFYCLVASGSESFSKKSNVVASTTLWVSRLSLVTRVADSAIEGWVLDAVTGDPVGAAEVDVWETDRKGNWKRIATVTTGEDGFFRHDPEEKAGTSRGYSSFLLCARSGKEKVSNFGQLGMYLASRSPQASEKTFLFTDRAIYRPGQIIQFKGISVLADTEKHSYKTLEGVRRTIQFLDPNDKEIASMDVTSNAYGSFSGSFTAPRDRLLGGMRLRDGDRGSAALRVEEYKRPKFRVEIDAPKESPKLTEPVTLLGKAVAYTGAAIDGAKVNWRVERMATLPPWLRWCWWFMPPPTTTMQIAHGEAVTGADGTFEVSFVAEPDRGIEAKAEPVFTYTLTTDVTDSAVETRSGTRALNVGYTALAASLSADEWQTPEKPVVIGISTASLNGDPEAAAGSVVVHRLKQPTETVRPPLETRGHKDDAPARDLSNPDAWELGEVVQSFPFTTDEHGSAEVKVTLQPGVYRAVLETKDRFGKKVTALTPVAVIDPKAEKHGVRRPFAVTVRKSRIEPGETFEAAWGSGYETARAFVEIEHRGRIIMRFWTNPAQTQQAFSMPVEESHRGGFTIHVTSVRNNRAHLISERIHVPWTNKDLSLKWSHMRSKLEPGAKETWSLEITGSDDAAAVAELAATLYDASLDAFVKHAWLRGFNTFHSDQSLREQGNFHNALRQLNIVWHLWTIEHETEAVSGRNFPSAILGGEQAAYGGSVRRKALGSVLGGLSLSYGAAVGRNGGPILAEAMPMVAPAAPMAFAAEAPIKALPQSAAPAEAPSADASIDLSTVSARMNLNETAFFFPQLVSDDNGKVTLTFSMPEALTTWRLLGFAHDRALRSGFIEGETVSAKDLMVQPNPPRFLREGDAVEFTVKVTNQSDQAQQGRVRLTFADAASLEPVDTAVGNATPEVGFEIPAKESRSFSWRIAVPDGQGFLNYKAVASTGRLSDGEEGALPVLSRRIAVTESLPLPIRDAGTKEFRFEKLLASGASDTLQHQSLTVQMVSQPAWYAVMALPYLMEFPHECSEQNFNRLYANALARHVAKSDPKIRRVFDLWKESPDALESPLSKNQDLKSLMIEETPWLRDAMKESEGRRNLGILFDDNRLEIETAGALQKLRDAQLDNGGWPWFPGGRDNEFITLYVVTGFGRLRHLGVVIDTDPALRALDRLDKWIEEDYRDIVKDKRRDENNFSPRIALYLYGRSFFLEDKPIASGAREAVDYFLGQARKYWPGVGSRMAQGHAALGLQRFGDTESPADIVKSLREFSVSNEELGMFWRDQESQWWWHRAPIETQAMMIELFRDVAHDEKAVDDCQVWLLKQKQTQAWRTTKATADAVYALLLGGTDKLASDALVRVSLGGVEVKPEKIEAGTGFYEKRFATTEIQPDMGAIKLVKSDKGVSWGSLHWQYLEDMRKITPHEGTPLTLKKTLFTKVNTKAGPELRPVIGPLAVGDELVVRVELRTDRDMEFVHLKDQRGSGTEPVNVLSAYKYQDGLAYYESTRDTASHFFIDYLRKGTYVFEYGVRVQLKGSYQSGIASVECMYAPEFNSHSESFTLDVAR